MGDANTGPPDPPWFTKPINLEVPSIFGLDEQGQPFELPYMRYGLVENEPMLLGTNRKNQNVWGDRLWAFPMLVLPFTTNIDDSAIEGLYTDYPFNWTLVLALFQNGDAGILADVHRYQLSFIKLQHMKKENKHLTRLLIGIQWEQEKHNKEIEEFLNNIIAIRERLTDTRVISWLAPAYQHLAIQQVILNYLYMQAFEASISNTNEPCPNTPRPPLRPTNPEPPSPASQELIITMAAEALPIKMTPAEVTMSGTMPIPPRPDYTASNPCGPHHTLSMFDKEDTRNPLPPCHLC